MDSSGACDIKESVNGPYCQSGFSVETRICPAKDGIAVSLCLIDSSKQSMMDRAMAEVRPLGWVSANTWDRRNENCSVSKNFDIADFPKEKEAPGYSKTLGQPRTALKAYRPAPPNPDTPVAHSRPTCIRTVRFAEQPCSPCLRRRNGTGTKNQECRYKESYNMAQGMESCQLKSIPSDRGVRTDPINFQRPIQKHSDQYPQVQNVNGNLGDYINIPSDSKCGFAELADLSEGANTCHTPPVMGTSEKCHIVLQGYPGEGSKDTCEEMIPRLHVVCGKKTTTFGLVSPKLNRRMPPQQDDRRDDKQHSPLDNNAWTCTTVCSTQKHNADTEKHGTRAPLFATTKPETCLLQSGLVCLTGGRDRSSRAVVEVYGDHQHWASPLLSSIELSKLLHYFHTISRKAGRELGMTVVYDTRQTPLHPQFTEALQMVQEQDPMAIHTVLLLMSKGKIHSHKKYPGEMEVVTSFKGLYKHIECSQLSPSLNGTFPYNYRNWLHMHQELYPFVLALKEATCMLLAALRQLDGFGKIDAAQDVQQCVHEQKALMKSVLEDAQLITLQKQGGALLARLRWESDVRSAQTKASREVMDTVECLYKQLEEQVHILGRRSSVLFKHFDLLLQLKELELWFSKIKEWFNVEGKQQMLEAETVEDHIRIIQEIIQCFSSVLSEANEYKHQTVRLATEAENIQGPDCPETETFHKMVSTLKSDLSDILSQAEQCCEELNTVLNVCHFCERASTMAVDCLEQLKQERLQQMSQQEKWTALQQCHEKLSEYPLEHFQEAKAQAYRLQSSLGMQVWNMTWLKCQEVSRQLEETLQELEQIQHQAEPVPSPNRCHGDGAPDHTTEFSTNEGPVLRQHVIPRDSVNHNEARICRDRDSIHGTVSCFNISFRQSRKGRKESKIALAADHVQSSKKPSHEHKQNIVEGSGTVGCQWFPWQHTSTNIKQDSSSSRILPSSCSETPALIHSAAKSSALTCSGAQTSGTTCSLVQSFSALRACQHNPYSQPGNVYSETLESEARTTTNVHNEETDSWESDGAKILSSPGSSTKNMKLLRIMEELLMTEFEYVRSLAYVLTHYLPLLAQPDVPPDLRGQRGRIFGNLEKLYQFHCHYFQQELQSCRTDPLMVGRCFLRHRENFGLYALYSKNKPQSDALVQQHKFFKRKQMELGDSMDLSSYLLKPVQRISKYSLLLQEMLEECGAAHNQEQLELQGAAEVVRFQLRHGNDLLTMDAIKDCDVNLKEQGHLIRQDEFYVTCRKKRALRRVFLFQDLILFTKTKKTHRGDEVYIYKQSLKTCDIGLTQNCGRSGLCFEIWFRRRRAQDTYILQADRQDVKEAWTADLQRILWEQALKNRELRKQELVFMGIDSKPFLNFEPTDDLHDRGIACHLPEKEVDGLLKSQNTVVTSLQSDAVVPRPESIGSGGSVSTSRSQSSSSSGRGSLSPSGFRENQVNESCHGIYIAGKPRNAEEHHKKRGQSGACTS